MFSWKTDDKKKKRQINPMERMPNRIEKRTFLGNGGERPEPPKKEMFTKQERVERIELVASKLKERYGKFPEAAMFIEYLRATDEIFARAEREQWSIERTEQEMIEGEIYLMSLNTGLDEDIFHHLYVEFTKLKSSARKVQLAAKTLIERYQDKYDGKATDFIEYIRDYVLAFSQSIEKGMTLNETKEQVIRARMKVLSASGRPPIQVLDSIYKEFFEMLAK